MRRTGLLVLGMTVALGAVFALNTPAAQTRPTTAPASQPVSKNSAITPASRGDNDRWMQRHQSFNDRAAQGEIDLLFIGDSITHGWEGEGKDVWSKYYGDRSAVNFGIGGDRTQHILWRIQNGNLNGLEKHPPKLIVLMIGTNNSNGEDHTAQEIAEGMTTIVKTLREKLPQTKVLLLGIFPRGETPSPQREKNAKASEIAAMVADNKNVFYLDIGKKFLSDDGSISKEIMPDALHLSPKGYEFWAEAIEPTVKELMSETKP